MVCWSSPLPPLSLCPGPGQHHAAGGGYPFMLLGSRVREDPWNRALKVCGAVVSEELACQAYGRQERGAQSLNKKISGVGKWAYQLNILLLENPWIAELVGYSPAIQRAGHDRYLCAHTCCLS